MVLQLSEVNSYMDGICYKRNRFSLNQCLSIRQLLIQFVYRSSHCLPVLELVTWFIDRFVLYYQLSICMYLGHNYVAPVSLIIRQSCRLPECILLKTTEVLNLVFHLFITYWVDMPKWLTKQLRTFSLTNNSGHNCFWYDSNFSFIIWWSRLLISR